MKKLKYFKILTILFLIVLMILTKNSIQNTFADTLSFFDIHSSSGGCKR